MATLALQTLGNTAIVWEAAAAGGDVFENSGQDHLLVLNTSGGPLRVRFNAQSQPTDPFTTTPNVDVTVADGSYVICKAVPPRWFNTGGGQASVTYPDGVSNLNVAAVRIPGAEVY